MVIPADAQLPVTGITPYIMPNADFYRIDTALVVPQLDTAGWKLKVHGMVEREVTIAHRKTVELKVDLLP